MASYVGPVRLDLEEAWDGGHARVSVGLRLGGVGFALGDIGNAGARGEGFGRELAGVKGVTGAALGLWVVVVLGGDEGEEEEEEGS